MRDEATSYKCGKCALCGNHGTHINMVDETKTIKTKTGKIFKLKQKLCCKDFGIYVAQCTTCAETYVGQTATSFATRWNGHRSSWKKFSEANKKEKDQNNEINEEQALFEHYIKHHTQ